MNLDKLRYVITVADEQSFTKAAKKLYITQPSLSLSIHSVEESIGGALFVRGKNSVTLTPIGKAYVDWAKATLESARKLEATIAKLKDGSVRQLEVGASWQRSAAFFPETINLFYGRTTNCNVRIKEDINYKLQNDLENDRLDMIIGLPNSDATTYTSVPLFSERFLLACSKEQRVRSLEPASPYPIVSKNALYGKDVIILQESQYLGKVFRNLLTEINYIPNKVTECYNLETAHSLVSRNLGVTLLPEVSVFSRELDSVKYYIFREESLMRPVAAVFKNNNPKYDDICLFAECLKEYIMSCGYPFLIK